MFNTLLVEDNDNFRQVISGILSSHFPLIRVDEVNDGERALSMVGRLHPDLIFMDIQLPSKNGLEVTREIKQLYKDIVVVILTSHSLPEYRQQAFRNGADCFLSKDDDTCVEDILARVEGALVRKSYH